MRILDSEIDSLMDEWMDGCGRILRDLTVQRKSCFFSRMNFCVATQFYQYEIHFLFAKVSLEHGSYERSVTNYKKTFLEELVR